MRPRAAATAARHAHGLSRADPVAFEDDDLGQMGIDRAVARRVLDNDVPSVPAAQPARATTPSAAEAITVPYRASRSTP